MGFLDKLLNKQEKSNEPKNVEQVPKSRTPIFKILSDGRLNVEFDNGANTSNEFYDRTRLTIDGSPLILAGKPVYKCVVAWDGRMDCGVLNVEDERENIQGTRGDYRIVLMELDLDRLKQDAEYCSSLSTQLLKRSRVNKLLAEGLKENPTRPCGMYIGGIDENNGKYFDMSVGRVSHYSNYMVKTREIQREKSENIGNDNRKDLGGNGKAFESEYSFEI